MWMIKKGLIAGIVIALTLVAFSTVFISDDSAAAGIEVCEDANGEIRNKNAFEYNGVYYDLCKNDSNHPEYGADGAQIAFVTGHINGEPGYEKQNTYYGGEVLEIPSVVKHEDLGDFTVVGIRCSAFQANKHPDWDTNRENVPLLNLKKVILPDTLVAIGVKNNTYGYDNVNGCSFSKCLSLKEVAIPEGSALEFIAMCSFQNTAIEVLDLSNCQDVYVRNKVVNNDGNAGVYESKLKSVDLSTVTYLENNAFGNCDTIENIVMPTSGTIDPNAFPNMTFYAEDGVTKLTGDALKGMAFKMDANGKMKPGHVATFVYNGGDVPDGKYLDKVYGAGDPLPRIIEKAGFTFHNWKDDSGIDVGVMPNENITIYAYWTMDRPDVFTCVYDRESHTPYADTADYTVTGEDTGMNAGTYDVTLTFNESYNLWKDGSAILGVSCDITWSITKKTITVSGITASDKVFDGKASAKIDQSGMALDGKIGNDEIVIGAVGEFVDRNVGNAKTVNIALRLEGVDAGNYVLAAYVVTATASITPATITGDIEQDGSLTYDGNMLTADVYSTLASVADEAITVTYSIAIDGIYSLNVPPFIEVGDHTVYYIAEAANHEIRTGSFTVTVSAPHNPDIEGEDHVLLLLFGGIAVVAGAMLVAPFIFGRP